MVRRDQAREDAETTPLNDEVMVTRHEIDAPKFLHL